VRASLVVHGRGTVGRCPIVCRGRLCVMPGGRRLLGLPPRRSACFRREARRRGLSVDSVRASPSGPGRARTLPTAVPRRLGVSLSCC
jgi:hypothetical protein